MNALLRPTNTTNCSTNNLKMMAAVICLTAVFVFANLAGFAQVNSNSEAAETISTVKAAKPNSTQVYTNYKGIADKNEAKKAWLQDHPEENVEGTVAPAYRTMPEAVTTEKSIESSKTDGNKTIGQKTIRQNASVQANVAVETKSTQTNNEVGTNNSSGKSATVSPAKVNTMLLAKPEATQIGSEKRYRTESGVTQQEK